MKVLFTSEKLQKIEDAEQGVKSMAQELDLVRLEASSYAFKTDIDLVA